MLSKAASLGDASGVVVGPGARAAAEKAGAYGAAKVYALEDDLAPLPQPSRL